MSGATVLIGSNQDDAASAVTGIGFSFDYEGVGYTDFSVSSNGGMSLGTTQIYAYSLDNINDGQYNPKIMAFMADGSTSTGNVSTVLVGSSPNRVRVIQWNTGVDYSAPAPNCLFQVWLHESTNVIEFHYGTGAPSGWASYWWAGISGATGTNYLNIRPGPTASNSDVTRLGAWPGSDQVLSFTPPSANCNTPAPGNTSAMPGALCPGMASALSLANPEEGPGISRQWESSPDGNTWTAISGATNTTYNTGALNTTTWYRCVVTCAIGPSSTASTPIQVPVSAPTPSYYVYTGTQYTEDFSTWTSQCSSNDVPDSYWTNSPAVGAGSWHSSNTTTAESGWSDVAGWNYPYTSLPGLPMARFHSRQSPSGVTGSLDFHVDLSAGTGAELVRFDFINYYGSGTLKVLISTDGGTTFTQSGATLTSNSSGTTDLKEFQINSTSATTVIRLQGTTAGGGNDIGVDNFRILAITCPKPTAPSANVTAPGSVDIGWTCTACTGSYYVEYGTTGFTPGTGTVAGPFSGSPATISGLANGSYQAYVRQDCGGNGISEDAGPVAFSILAGDFCSNAIDLATLPLSDWSIIGSTLGASNNIGTSACSANQPGPDLLFYHDVEAGATLSLGLWSYANQLSVAYGGSCPGSTSLACSQGGYFDPGANVQMVNDYETMIWTNTGCAAERVYVLADGLTTDGDVYVFNYAYTPPGGPFCAAVNGVTVNTVNTGTGATVSWPASCSGNVIVEYGPTGFTPGTDGNAGGGTVVAVNGTSTTLSGLTLDQAYDVYVRQDCGSGVYSTNSTATPFTLHNGDDCSRVIALSGETGSMTINTSGTNNDAAFCNAGDIGGDLILSYTVQPGFGIYFTSAPTAPYSGSVAIGAGSPCPGSSLLHCTTGAVDYFWLNTGSSAETVYFVQDGGDEGETTVSWTYFAECALNDTDGDGINDCDDTCINFPGQEGDACMNGGMPGTIIGCQCVAVCNGNEVVVSITVDNNALDLSWQITDASNAVIASQALTMADDNTNYSKTVCLGNTPVSACYGFRLLDSYGDGLSGVGGWELRTTDGKTILRDDFASGSASPASPAASAGYGTSHSFCLPLGTAHIAANECGIFNNDMLSKVYCNKVAGASQYQFELSNPDAGFLRRTTTSRNYVRFDEMAANPPVPGVKYFVRVRSNAAGPLASANWGSGCEMGLGIAETVTCSGLIPAPAYGHSCNEERAFNKNNSYIYATPVVGADEYQFRIFNLDEGYDQTFTRSTYILQLKWNSSVAPPLINGYTYHVEVNVNVNGVYSGFCPSSCTITINNNPAPAGRMVIAEAQPEFSLWPNPNDGERVNVAVEGLAQDITTAELRLMDLTGRLALASTLPVADGHINQVIELGGAANGTYLLQITAGGNTYTHRVVVNK